MGSVYERWLRLEEKHLEEGIELSAEQVAKIEKYNPAFKERHVESSKPGELLSADTFYVGTLKGVGKVYLHALVDTYGSYAFGFLHTGKKPECAATLLHNDVLPFYEEHGIKVAAVLTDNGPEFIAIYGVGTPNHPFPVRQELCTGGVLHGKVFCRARHTVYRNKRFDRHNAGQ